MTPDIMAKLGIDESSVKPNTKSEQHVWVNTGDKVEQRTLKTGLNDGINLIALSGVNTGEEIVLSASIGKKRSNTMAASIIP